MENRIAGNKDHVYAVLLRKQDGHTFLWKYHGSMKLEACLHVRCAAADPDYTLTHPDADAIIQKIREAIQTDDGQNP